LLHLLFIVHTVEAVERLHPVAHGLHVGYGTWDDALERNWDVPAELRLDSVLKVDEAIHTIQKEVRHLEGDIVTMSCKAEICTCSKQNTA
jgi:hypothetical protein